MVSTGEDQVNVNVIFEFSSEKDFTDFIKTFIPEAERWGLEINLVKKGLKGGELLTK